MKLVRDKIPSIIRSNGSEPITHIADDKEYGERLKEKLQEEVDEFMKDENADELADILEVIDAIIAHKRLDKKKVIDTKHKKLVERGGFAARIVWEGNKPSSR